MNVGIVVDGEAEFAAIGLLYGELKRDTRHTFLNPLKADIQPLAPIGAIAERCTRPCRQLIMRGAGLVIVLIDRETRVECPGDLAAAIQSRVPMPEAAVVIKNKMFENWLIADVDALAAQHARFDVSRATRRAVQPGKADNVDALMLLKRSVRRGGYDKVADAKRILAKADPLRLASHSRSFRKFLRATEHGSYIDQSQRPCR